MCLYINVLIESVEKFLIARTVADIPTNGKQMLRGALETDDSMGEITKLAFFSRCLCRSSSISLSFRFFSYQIVRNEIGNISKAHFSINERMGRAIV